MAQHQADESRLAALLARCAERAETLRTMLEAERSTLGTATADAIVDTAHAKQPLIEEFEALGRTLEQALRGAGIDGGNALERWLAETPDGPLADNLRKLLGVLAECRQANARNAAAVRQLARHNRHMLSLVRGETPGEALYDHDGRARPGALTRYAASA